MIMAAAGNSSEDLSVYWDSGNSHGNYTFDNEPQSGKYLDAHKTSGDTTWGQAAQINKSMGAGSKYSIDFDLITKEPEARDNFGILKTSAGGTVDSAGYLAQNTSNHYGFQPEGSVANGDIITLEFDYDGATLKWFKNGVAQATISSITTDSVEWTFAYGNNRTGGELRIREEVYSPSSDFLKLIAVTA